MLYMVILMPRSSGIEGNSQDHMCRQDLMSQKPSAFQIYVDLTSLLKTEKNLSGC